MVALFTISELPNGTSCFSGVTVLLSSESNFGRFAEARSL